MRLYKKTSTTDSTNTDFEVYAEKSPVCRRYRDDFPDHVYAENGYNYEFIWYVERGTKFYTVVCHNTQSESKLFWDKDEAIAYLKDFARDFREEYEEEPEMELFTHKVVKCTTEYENDAIALSWEKVEE